MSDDVYAITFEQVEETAREFYAVALLSVAWGRVIIFDQQCLGLIKEFENSPEGLVRARRWAVRMEEADETSQQSFEELRAERIKELES